MQHGEITYLLYLLTDATEEMLKQQKEKEKEKKKRSKDKKKQQEAQDLLDSAQAEVKLAQQKAAMVQDGNNRKVRRVTCFGLCFTSVTSRLNFFISVSASRSLLNS
jgi:flagellar biosynthesis component FlhA